MTNIGEKTRTPGYGLIRDNLIRTQVDFVHHQSTMHQWEREGDLEEKFRDWKYTLENNQKVYQYYNEYKDNSITLKKTHLAYISNTDDKLHVFSCNLDNFHYLDIGGLDIEESEKGLERITR